MPFDSWPPWPQWPPSGQTSKKNIALLKYWLVGYHPLSPPQTTLPFYFIFKFQIKVAMALLFYFQVSNKGGHGGHGGHAPRTNPNPRPVHEDTAKALWGTWSATRTAHRAPLRPSCPLGLCSRIQAAFRLDAALVDASRRIRAAEMLPQLRAQPRRLALFDFRAQMRFLITPPLFLHALSHQRKQQLFDTPAAQRDHTVAVARGFNRHPCANVRIALSAGDRGHVYWGSRQVRRSPPHQTLEHVVMQCTLVCMQG